MGMDFVELAIELEDRYGVDAHGFDFAPVVTVADVAAFVVARMPTPTKDHMPM